MTTPKKDDNSKRQEPRRLGEQSINMSPEKQNTSQIPMTNQQEELKKEEEEEKLNAEDLAEQQKRLQMMHDLVQLQRSDYISPVELGYLQGNFMVLNIVIKLMQSERTASRRTFRT